MSRDQVQRTGNFMGKTKARGAVFALALLALSSVEALAAPLQIHYGPEKKQFGELFLPAAQKRHPVIILVHGGAWRNYADLAQTRLISEDLSAHGFAVWNIEYRTIDDAGGGFPGTFLDVGAAADYLRELAKTHALDLSCVIAVGHSAGGHLALWLASRGSLPASSPIFKIAPLAIAGVVDLAGPPDLRADRDLANAAGGPDTIEMLIGARERGFDDGLKDTSPAELLPIRLPQILVFGSSDTTVPVRLAQLYQAIGVTKGEKVEVRIVPNASHADFVQPRTNAWKESLKAIRHAVAIARRRADGER